MAGKNSQNRVNNVTIDGCILDKSSSTGVYVSEYCNNIQITNNKIDATTNGVRINSADDSTDNVTISINTIIAGTTGIIFDDCFNCKSFQNKIQATNGILEAGYADFNMALLNDLTACATKHDIDAANSHASLNMGDDI